MVVTLQAEAANWLMLQGAERQGTAPRAKLWGFLQPTYRATDGADLQAGPWKGQEAQFNQIAPQLSSNKQFNIARARIGVRGTGFPLNSKINYFFLAEFGSNGITWPAGGKGAAKITDASVTFSYIRGARIRAGQFKTPGAEEGLQAIHVFDYVNFTNVTNQLLLERFFDSDGSVANDVNAPNGPVGAFRDIGVQIFDTFKTSAWNTSYAIMFGNGNGIARGDNNGDLDSYYYLSTEKVFAGQGGRVESLKLFAWYQTGKRTLLAGATQTEGSFDRTRNGVGLTFRRNKIRAAAEYIMAATSCPRTRPTATMCTLATWCCLNWNWMFVMTSSTGPLKQTPVSAGSPPRHWATRSLMAWTTVSTCRSPASSDPAA